MEKKTIDTLRVMLCGELEEVTKKGSLTHESLDIIKDLLESIKNLGKIEEFEKEKQSLEMMGYSQRPMGGYYMDDMYANGNSYARNQYSMMDGGSYARGGGGNSNYGYNPMFNYPMYSGRRGYSRDDGKQEMIEELHEMMNKTSDEKIKMTISEAIEKMNR